MTPRPAPEPSANPLAPPSRNDTPAVELARLEQFRFMIEEAGEEAYLATPDGRLVYANKAAARSLGYTVEELLAHPVAGFDPEFGPRFAAHFAALKQGDIPPFETVHIARDGRRVTKEIKSVYLRIGEAEYVCGFGRDITERKRAEATLRQSEENYRQLVESANSIIVRWDHAGRVIFMNEFALRFFGFAGTDIVGRSIVGTLVPETETTGRDLAALIRDLSDHPERYTRNENENTRSNGERVWIDWTNRPIYDAPGRLREILSIGHDVTDRRLAQQAARLNEARLAALLDLSQRNRATLAELAHYALEQAVRLTRSGMGYVAFANADESVLTIHAWSESAMKECAVPDLPRVYPVAQTGLWGEAVRQRRPVITNDYPAPNPLNMGLPFGDVQVHRHLNVPVFDDDRIVIVAGVGNKEAPYDESDARQLTLLMGGMWSLVKRHQAEEALRQSEQKLKSIFLAAPVGIGMVCNRIIKEANDQLLAITGYARQELIDASARILYPTDADYEYVGQEKYRQISEKGTGTVETRWQRKDGTVIDVLLSSTPLVQDDWSLGVTFSALDITARKQAEEDRLRLERQVQQTQKLESLGVLAGGIAHDFNNLLTAIMGNINLALLDLSPVAPAREELREAEKATRRAADLAKQMLAYSGKGRFETQRLDLRDVVREMTHMLQVSISKKALLRFHFADTTPTVEVDPTQLRQVVMNLVINASEAIGDRSGVIAIATGARDCTESDLAGGWLQEPPPPGLYVFLEVSDTGCGIKPEQVARIFDPFYTTKFTGRGLGLAAVLGIVRGHRGAINVDSQPGQGTTFRVYLPVASQPLPQPGKSEPHPSTWRGSGLVLLVDDEESVRAIAKKTLERLGFQVLTADNGRQALDMFQPRAADFACVVLDLTMPHMDGEEALRELQRIRPEVRVVLASGYSEHDLVPRFASRGLAGFIQKPFTLANLQVVLQKALAP